jgi:hypothetical protein
MFIIYNTDSHVYRGGVVEGGGPALKVVVEIDEEGEARRADITLYICIY